MSVIIAIDAGTTGIRAFAVDNHGVPCYSAYSEFHQHFPQPGWVEHDASDIWATTQKVLAEVVGAAKSAEVTVSAIGITNQRETVVAWDSSNGRPACRAIVWQDRRTAGRCDALQATELLGVVRSRTGLVLDPYFSATKIEWLFRTGAIEASPTLMIGTVDSWILWNLTGGPNGGVHATDPSNASRTMLYDIVERRWSDELCGTFGVPISVLGEVRPSSGRFGVTDPSCAEGLSVGVSGIAGDQQAALFGQACFEPGMTKNTYGTGSFVLVNVGSEVPNPVDGLLTTVAWELSDGTFAYAMEGAIFITGAAVQWLRDGLEIIGAASETESLAASVLDSGGVFLVPAFTGLGSPWWDPYARGSIFGITRGTTKAHIARACVEAMAYQTADVVAAITAASGTAPSEMRVDGGASVMNLLCQFQADILGVTVRRSEIAETTAMGAAYLAGIAEGIWPTPAEAAGAWRAEASFEPRMAGADSAAKLAMWHRAVDRSRHWAN